MASGSGDINMDEGEEDHSPVTKAEFERFKDTLKAELLAELKADLLAELKADVLAELKADVLAELKADLLAELKAELLAELKVELLAEFKAELAELEDMVNGHATIVEEHDKDLATTREYPRKIQISKMNDTWCTFLCNELNLKMVNVDELPAVYGFSSRPSISAYMVWPPNKREDECQNEYLLAINKMLDEIKKSYGAVCLASGVKDKHHLLDTTFKRLRIAGTTDVIFHRGDLNNLANAQIVCQLKKTGKMRKGHMYQSFAELLGGSHKAEKPVFALLTDLCTRWEYMWLTEGDRDTAGIVHRAVFNHEKGVSALIRILQFDESRHVSPCVSIAKIMRTAGTKHASTTSTGEGSPKVKKQATHE